MKKHTAPLPASKSAARPAYLRLPSVITNIHPAEIRPVLWLTLNLFVLFTAYYVLKPIREGLILSLPGGAELKSGVGAAQAVFFILLAPFYRVFTARYSGRKILVGIYLLMALNLLVFWGLGSIQFHFLGVVFFFWVGVFNMLTISQTYSLCTELFTPEQGKRVFPLIALGAAVGAVMGSYGVKAAVKHLGLLYPMVVAASLLVVCALLIHYSVPKYFPKTVTQNRPVSSAAENWERLLGGLQLVFQKRYIALIAFMILVSNLINTNSEYMLGRLVSDHFRSVLGPAADAKSLGAAIGDFYASFSLWVNLASLFLQAFVVSRLIRKVGVFRVLWFVPLLALFSYGIAVVFPLLAVIRFLKMAENTTDYSLNNTAREILYLPLSIKEKYEAKLAADTVFRRLGDAISRPLVFLLMEVLTVGIAGFAFVNLILVGIWLSLVYKIGKEQPGAALKRAHP